MKKTARVLTMLVIIGSLISFAFAGDTLDEVKKKGVLVVGVKFFTPPFGFIDMDSGEVVGYDVDFARAIAERLGVTLKLKPVTSENRISRLIDKEVDLIAATMTRTADRERIIDFSRTYFLTGQSFLVKKGSAGSLKDLEKKRIGTAKGSTSELNAKDALPGATILTFEDYFQAGQALLKGEVDAVTTDEPILVSILGKLPPGEFEILPVRISEEPYGLGIRKGETQFLDFVNSVLLDLEKSGEGGNISRKWFTPKAPEAERAGGVVVRKTGVDSRVLVMPLKGVFEKDADVSVYDPRGNMVATGKVVNVYSDEIYVDVEKAKAVAVAPGFVVGMNVTDEEARDIILKRQDLLKSVTEEIGREKESLQAELKKETEEDKKQREEIYKKQMESEKRRMELQYQYDRDRYYYYYDDRYYRYRRR
ncbi:MAG: transporter substrate-binding domain-containing protein [Deltaproteobacteria bacterium]|nr:transporter substrate-binding domain-containing protein [Deltaproteobacteria bacterium]NIS76270.1 transporter substrate-binding domain-containing protein [Deltaproteobacteria bacterium]